MATYTSKPDFICKNGICDLDLVSKTISTHISPRCQQHLASLPRTLDDNCPIIAEASVSLAVATSPPLPPLLPIAAEPPKIPPTTNSAIIDLISDVWNGSEPLNYHAQLHLGTPSLPFLLSLDTGSTLLWIQSLLSPTDAPISPQPIYIPTLSTTSKNLLSKTSITYGDGSTLIASLFTDTFLLGGLTASAQIFGAAAENNIRDTLRSGKSNGILGLGFGGDRNIIQTLRIQGGIGKACLALVGPRNDPKLADKIDRERTVQPRGQVRMGEERWIVKLDGVRVNGRVVFRNQLALVDTGTAYIVTSDVVFGSFMGVIHGAEMVKGRKGMFSFPEESLRSVEFVFGGRSLELRRQDFGLGGLVEGEERRMVSSIVSLQDGGEAFGGMEHLWVIGGIFLDNVVTVFDYAEKRVGFATIVNETEVKVHAQL
ncbi:aspartic peptidase domain-containing protein [Trichophaea hybrida]|nr:aspartic peptidase domain-containing protein [Trichophaea hybrida]